MEIDINKRSFFSILPSLLLNRYINNNNYNNNNINSITDYLNIENYINCNNESDMSNICNIISSILIYHLCEKSLINDTNELLSFSNLIGSLFSSNQTYVYLSLSLYLFDRRIDDSFALNLLLNNNELLGNKEREMAVLLLKEISIKLSYTYLNSITNYISSGIDIKLIFDIFYEISLSNDKSCDVYILYFFINIYLLFIYINRIAI